MQLDLRPSWIHIFPATPLLRVSDRRDLSDSCFVPKDDDGKIKEGISPLSIGHGIFYLVASYVLHPLAKELRHRLAIVEPSANDARKENQNAGRQAYACNDIGLKPQGKCAHAHGYRTSEFQMLVYPFVHEADALALIEPCAGNADEKEEDAESQPNCAAHGMAQHGSGKQACAADDGAQYLHQFIPD